MTLLVHECKPSTEQQIRPTENLNLVAIRPHLYVHGSPAGNIHVEVQDVNGRIIDSSNSLAITALKTDAYAHGYFEFDIDVPLISGQTYLIAVVCDGGYSFAESAYVGVCVDWDNPKQTATYTPNSGTNAPLDLELWFRSET